VECRAADGRLSHPTRLERRGTERANSGPASRIASWVGWTPMVSSRRPPLVARIGACAIGLSIGAAGFIGAAPKFMTPRPSSGPTASHVVVHEGMSTSTACVSALSGGGFRLTGTELTRTPLGCVPTRARQAEAGSGAPRKPAPAAKRARPGRAPLAMSRPADEGRVDPPASSPTATRTPPNAPFSVPVNAGMAPPTTTEPVPATADTSGHARHGDISRLTTTADPGPASPPSNAARPRKAKGRGSRIP
jgi:hypothetical protein